MEAFPYQIRLIQPADLPEFRAVRSYALEESPSAFAKFPYELEELSDELLISMVCPGENQFTFGAFVNSGEIIGTAGLFRGKHQKTGHKGTIWGVFVKPEYRRKGISKALLRKVIDYASKLKEMNLINLSVSQTQTSAIELYLSFGFKIYGKEPRAIKVGEDYFSEELLVLDLTN